MVIQELTIHLSKRIGFSGIKTLIYKPTHPQQIILGLNGVGKSYLISELSPLPAISSNYYKGGYKKIIISHQNSNYTLTNDFSNKSAGHHSFIKDGNELNTGGTLQVQKTLVKEYFNLDQELFDLLTSVTNFREMSPNQRRAWIVRMADDNMEYAIKLYKDVKSKLKEEQTTAKYIASVIAEETRLYDRSTSIKSDLKKRVDSLTNVYKELNAMVHGKDINDNPSMHLTRIETWLSKVDSLVMELLNTKEVENELATLEIGEANFATIDTTINILKDNKSKLLKDYEKICEEVEAIKRAGSENIKELTDKKNSLLETLDTLYCNLGDLKDIPEDNINELISTTNTITETFTELINNLPDNSEGKFTKEKDDWHNGELEKLTNDIDALERLKAKEEFRYNSYMDTIDVQCPSCATSFKPGYVGITPEEMRNTISSISKQIEVKLEYLEQVKLYLLEASNYRSMYQQLITLIKSCPSLKQLWDILVSYKLTKYHPTIYSNLFIKWKNALVVKDKIVKIKSSIGDLDTAINLINTDYVTAVGGTKQSISTVEDRIGEIDAQLNDLDRIRRLMVKKKSLIGTIDRKQKEIDNHLIQINNALTEYEVDSWLQFAEEEANKCMSEISGLVNDLNKMEMSDNRIERETINHAKVTKKIQHLKILIDELSPQNGLIAEYSMNFITEFTNHMNQIINQIWTYDMQILPVTVNEDLTYKFPLYMADSGIETPDINRASTAQKGVIDFAFKLLLINYLGLEDYPLYIDELTPNLDETHRINIMKYVKEYVESNRCSQMFMISHYVSNQNTFARAEFVVLSQQNLLHIPDTYNTGLTIIYD